MAPQIAHPNPSCQKCDTGMILDGITPCAEGYDLWSYRCLICGSTFNMVEARRKKPPASFLRVVANAVQRTAITIVMSFGAKKTMDWR